ncbi:MAG: hypothetical protein PHQ43_01020 [Dehalococcoidales bacterium]|nr:hypothetical protein [Dehalococcoidales bacterium]
MKRETANDYLIRLDDLDLSGIGERILSEEGRGGMYDLCRAVMTIRAVVSAVLADLREY